jgi:TPR repeat protein
VTAPAATPPAAAPAAAAPPAAAPAAAAPPAPAPAAAAPAPAPSAQSAPTLDREEIAILIKRGEDFIAAGDLAAARIVLRRAADAGDAGAALALAATYDPIVLTELKAYGFAADVEMARTWYQKAKEFGSAEAPRRLEMLASQAR